MAAAVSFRAAGGRVLCVPLALRVLLPLSAAGRAGGGRHVDDWTRRTPDKNHDPKLVMICREPQELKKKIAKNTEVSAFKFNYFDFRSQALLCYYIILFIII